MTTPSGAKEKGRRRTEKREKGNIKEKGSKGKMSTKEPGKGKKDKGETGAR